MRDAAVVGVGRKLNVAVVSVGDIVYDDVAIAVEGVARNGVVASVDGDVDRGLDFAVAIDHQRRARSAENDDIGIPIDIGPLVPSVAWLKSARRSSDGL